MNYYILAFENHKPKLIQAYTMTEATAGARRDLIACYKVQEVEVLGIKHYYIDKGGTKA